MVAWRESEVFRAFTAERRKPLNADPLGGGRVAELSTSQPPTVSPFDLRAYAKGDQPFWRASVLAAALPAVASAGHFALVGALVGGWRDIELYGYDDAPQLLFNSTLSGQGLILALVFIASAYIVFRASSGLNSQLRRLLGRCYAAFFLCIALVLSVSLVRYVVAGFETAA